MKKAFVSLLFTALLLTPVLASAAAIDIFAAPDAYQNGGVNPCIFSGNGNNGCNQVNFPFPAWVESTQTFNPTNPLVNEITPGVEIAQFAAGVGKNFFIGFDENQAGGATQTITNLTITFRDINGNVLGSGYTLGGTPVSLDPLAQGEGWTDYVMSAGCSGPVVGSGVNSVCLGQLYTPFVAPTGTRDIIFTYGMGTFNDGAERLFLIHPGPTPTPFDDPPPPPDPVPEPATMLLMGSGLMALAKYRNKLKQ